MAITTPLRVTLTDGERTLRAVFKDEIMVYPNFRFGDGREVQRARDSCKHEIAAFHLDLLKRREKIIDRADRLIAEHGQDKVLY